MKVKNIDFVIEPQNPFKEDKLNRVDSAQNLTYLIKTIKQPFVLSINSPWGTGKTTFIKMWAQYLKNKDFSTLYFNAWENDYFDNPLISFIGEIQTYIDKLEVDKNKKATIKKYFNNAKQIGGKVIERSIPLALKIGTHGILDLDNLSEKAISDFVAKVAKEKIDKYEEEKLTLKSFKKTLQKIALELSTSKQEQRPLVFFIDELDRCRPHLFY